MGLINENSLQVAVLEAEKIHNPEINECKKKIKVLVEDSHKLLDDSFTEFFMGDIEKIIINVMDNLEEALELMEE